MNGAPPLVTVAMPVFNAGEHLRLSVLSIIGQTFTDWELLIIDDGSTDRAFQDIADIQDARIRILRDGKNLGLAVRLNECIDLARGKYFARMDADDVSFPERFARQVAALQSNEALDLVAVRAITLNDRNAVTGYFPCQLSHEEICARPWMGFYFPHPAWMGRIGWFRKYRYTVPTPLFCEDQELLLRSYQESRFETIDEVLFGYRVSENTNWPKLAKTRRAVLRFQLRCFAGNNQWHFAFLAIAAFIAKSCRDLLAKLGNRSHRPGRDGIDSSVSAEWVKILDSLNAKSITP